MTFVQKVVQEELGLSLSLEKTSVTNFRKGFSFLGFQFSSYGITVSKKSMDKFKDKVRKMSVRSHNLDQKAITRINRSLLGFAQYFATAFSMVKRQFEWLDKWIRKRIRCMKFKRVSRMDNYRLRNKHLANFGLVATYSLT